MNENHDVVLCHSGEQAARKIVNEGRRVADKLLEPKRAEMQKQCDEVEMLMVCF